MRERLWRVVVVIAVFLIPALGGAADAPPNSVPLTLHDAGHVTVTVAANGVGPFRFLLDTGSTGSAVFQSMATRLALVPTSRTEVVTATGSNLREVVRLGRLRVGAAEVPDIDATLLTDDERRQTGLPIDGILGQDFLSKLHYTIDYRRRRLIWDDLGVATEAPLNTRPKGTRLPLLMASGRSIVELPQHVAGTPPLRFVADTGASVVVVFEGRSAISVPMVADGHAEAATVLSTRKFQLARLLNLKVGTLALLNQPAVILPYAHAEPDVDGLLPLHIFASVSFRPREGVVVLSR